MDCLACLESTDVDFEIVQRSSADIRRRCHCSSTMATEPFCVANGKPEHTSICGAFKANMREADDELMARASVFVDSRDTTIAHIGELIAPISRVR